MKKIIQIQKKTVTHIQIPKDTSEIPNKKQRNICEGVLPEHMHVFRTLQHFGFIGTHKTAPTDLEKKILQKYSKDVRLADVLQIQKKVLDKTLEQHTLPAHIGYSIDKDIYMCHIVGTKKNIYDALAVEAGFSVAHEILGPKADILVEISFVGDKESVQKFSKELQHFFKKHAAELPKNIAALVKKDMYEAYRMLDGVSIKPKVKKSDKDKEQVDVTIPNPIDYLSPASRAEFKEILEYIEALDMNFRIQPFLFASPEVTSGLIFSIKADYLEIYGSRHDNMAKKVLNKKEVPIVSLVISGLKKATQPKKIIKIIEETDIKFFYAQLGPEARFKTLKVMDMMRCAKIPMHQAISKEKISAQLAHAERLNVPYLLLVGHKEALQNSVMVRNMRNLSQESVELASLIEYLKKLL
ncbi:MAG: His/Gly/Thr/Pro-type tRNA ligase C-terminal domain-containing protein [Patescibacteria group bacterium]